MPRCTLSFALERDFNPVVMDDDPINRGQDQFACLSAPDAGRHVGGETILLLLSAQLFYDKSLHIIGSDAGPRAFALPPQLRLTDVIAVAVSPTHRIGRRHPVAAVVEDETAQNSAALDPSLPALREIARELGLNGIPEVLVHDGARARPDTRSLVHDLAAIDPVPQQVIERAPAERAAPERPGRKSGHAACCGRPSDQGRLVGWKRSQAPDSARR